MATKTKSDVKPIYVINGKDEFLVDGEYVKLLDKLIEPEQRPMGLWQVDADKADVIEILDELRTLPFLADHRVVVIKDADDFISENREVLERYFDKPCPSGVLVMTVGSWRSNTKLAKKLVKVGQLISVGEIKPWQMAAFISKYAKERYNTTLTAATANLLVEFAGDEPGRLCSEVDKLVVYTDKAATISAKDVELLIGQNRMFNAFSVIDAMTAGNMGAATLRLRKMFEADRNTAFTVVGAFAYHFRKMFNAKVLLDKGVRQDQVARQLGIWFNKEAFFGQLRKTTLEKTGRILQELGQIDYSIKTGRATAEGAMEQLVLKSMTQ